MGYSFFLSDTLYNVCFPPPYFNLLRS